MDKIKITLKTFFGLENVLKEELAELGYTNVEIQNRAVQLEGNWKDVYFFNLHVSCAINVDFLFHPERRIIPAANTSFNGASPVSVRYPR